MRFRVHFSVQQGQIWDLDAVVADFPNCCIVLAWDEGEQESWIELVASELGCTISQSTDPARSNHASSVVNGCLPELPTGTAQVDPSNTSGSPWSWGNWRQWLAEHNLSSVQL